jgi:hypothetical protein
MFKKSICCTCIASLIATGCATQQNGQPSNPSDSNNNAALRCVGLTAGGAVLGALIGGKNGAAKGAIAGLAACAVVEIASRQTRSSSEVDAQYRMSNNNQLPPYAKVDGYSTVVTPNGVAKAGDPISVHSTIRVIAGVNEPVQEVKEVLVAYAPSGEEFKRGEKKVNDYGGSGEYDNTFTVRLPSGSPQGNYRLTTQVFVNGKPGQMRQSNMQIAWNEGSTSSILVAAK